MNRIVIIAGSCLIVFGILMCILSFPVAPSSETLIDEAFVVPVEMHYYYYVTFILPKTLHIDFTVAGGSSPAVDFWVMNETEYQKMNASQNFYYYTAPSRVSISKADIDWTPPMNTKIYFVWDNSLSLEPKTVAAHFVYGDYQSILPLWTLSIGFVILFLGLGTTSYGYRPPNVAKKYVIVGYVFAALGGFIGIIMGLDLRGKESIEEKSHGKVIIVIGIVATLTYLLALLLPK